MLFMIHIDGIENINIFGSFLKVPYKITLHIFSGRPDPTFLLTYTQSSQLDQLLSSTKQIAVSNEKMLGYKGFEITDNTQSKIVEGIPSVEKFLLETIKNQIGSEIYNHISSRIGLSINTALNESSFLQLSTTTSISQTPICRPTIIKNSNPDAPTTFSPNTDCMGYFRTCRRYNNCYNYAVDIVTDTFAQPGVGTGLKYSSFTCDNMASAVDRDGVGGAITRLSNSSGNNYTPSSGHVIVLLIWPGVDFHFARKDKNLYWSHKPGQTPVRDRDNSNKPILDPKKADWNNYQFCQYYVTKPSITTIK
jgi:hypothetical protein